MASGNPTLTEKTFLGFPKSTVAMTLDGTINKTVMLLLLVVASAAFTWTLVGAKDIVIASILMFGGAITGFILAIIIVFRPQWAPTLAPFYALCEGFLLGGLSSLLEQQLPGIAIQAVGITFGTMLCMLAIYKAKLITVTEKFRLGLFAATGAIALIYLVSTILRLFGVSVPFIHENGLFGIIFSLIVVGIAALNLVLDFDFIEKGVSANAPKFMEWYAAFGLMVTLIWLYVEILRLLSKIRSRR